MNKYEVEQRYPDLLEKDNDPSLQNLVRDLDAIYTESMVPSRLTWAAMRARSMEDTLTKRALVAPFHVKPIYRFSLSLSTAISLLFVTLALASAASVAFSPQVRYVLGLESQVNQTRSASDFTALNQSRTVSGINIKLEAAYADQLDIVVGFSTHSSTVNHSAIVAQLHTKQGQSLPSGIGAFFTGDETKTTGEAWHYDATSITGDPKQLDLVLDVTVNNQKATFAFTIPFHGGKVVALNGRRATSNGITVVLEKAIIAKSGTMFLVQGLPLKSEVTDSSLQVPAGKKNYGEAAGVFKINASDPYERVLYEQTISAQPGSNWTLTLKNIAVAKNGKNTVLNTWTFTFPVQ